MMMEPPERRSAATPGGGGSFSSTTYVRRRASGGGAALRRLNRASKKMALAGKRRVSSVITRRIYLEWNDANKCSTSSTALLMNAHDIFESLISSLTCIYHRELSLV